jgi:hypothetical protein
MYMLESLRDQMGGGKKRDVIDKEHIQILSLTKRQSKQDFPRGSMRNGLIDGTKYQSSEQKGNLLTTLYCTYNKWKLCYEEILKFT